MGKENNGLLIILSARTERAKIFMLTSLLFHTDSIAYSMQPLIVHHLNVTAVANSGCGGGGGDPSVFIRTALDNIIGAMTAIGAAVCALGIAIGGLMRATSFGSERRISDSNTAIACAIVGLLTVLLAQIGGTWVSTLVTPQCTSSFTPLIPHLIPGIQGVHFLAGFLS